MTARMSGLSRALGVEPFAGAVIIVWQLVANSGRLASHGPLVAVAHIVSYLFLGVAVGATRRAPKAALAAMSLLVVLQVIVAAFRFDQNSWPAYIVLLYVAFSSGWLRGPRSKWTALGVVLSNAIIIALLLTLPAFDTDGGVGLINGMSGNDVNLKANVTAWVVTLFVGSLLTWLVGSATSARADRIQRDRERRHLAAALEAAEVELQTTIERERIAQDVHDIMAHSLAVIAAQADGARFLLEKRPEATRGSLEAISKSARESLVEVRMLIDSLHPEPEGHSRPTLDEVPALISRMEQAGLRVSWTTEGPPGVLLASQELAVYRIIQESLTNALKHADPARPVVAELNWSPNGVAVRVSSQGLTSRKAVLSTGRGINGMRERARLAGGYLTAQPDASTPPVFRVEAFIPTPKKDNHRVEPIERHET